MKVAMKWLMIVIHALQNMHQAKISNLALLNLRINFTNPINQLFLRINFANPINQLFVNSLHTMASRNALI